MTKQMFQMKMKADKRGRVSLPVFDGCKVKVTVNNVSRWRVIPKSGMLTVTDNADKVQTIDIEIDVVRKLFPGVDLRRLCRSLNGMNRIIEVEE